MKTLITTLSLAIIAFSPSVAFADEDTGEAVKDTFEKVGGDIKEHFADPAKDFFEGIPDYAKCMTNYDPGYNEGERKCGHHLTEKQQEEADRLFAGMSDRAIRMHAEYSLNPTQFVVHRASNYDDNIDNLRNPDSSGPETGFADSGNEGPTSAAQESDQ